MEQSKVKKVLFLLKNGIGFGHFKRALVIARYLRAQHIEVFFIAQAKSFDIFKNCGFKVFNFPMVEQAKTNNEQFLFYETLNTLIEKIDPDVILEDTYPDEYYLSLPAVRSRNKILILRRLNSQGILNYIKSGLFNEYNKIFVLQDKNEFIAKQVYDLNKRFFKTNKFIFFGDVFDKPKTIPYEIRHTFCKDKEKLVVVNCGAGGLQIGEDFTKILFKNVLKIVPKIQKKMNDMVKFVVVSGPYTDIDINKNYLKENNVEIIQYFPKLSELFCVSDLNILRPGYNSTMESINGLANTILVPSVSFMEDQNDWCVELRDKYGIDYLLDYDEDSLCECIIKNLNKTKKYTDLKNYANEVATAIKNYTQDCVRKLPEICLCGDYVSNHITNLTNIKNTYQIIDSIVPIKFYSDTLLVVGNEQFGINKDKLKFYHGEIFDEKNIVEIYQLYSQSKINILKEIANMSLKDVFVFLLPSGLSQDDINYICNELSEDYSLIDIDTYISNKWRKILNGFKWKPWEPYYKDLT